MAEWERFVADFDTVTHEVLECQEFDVNIQPNQLLLAKRIQLIFTKQPSYSSAAVGSILYGWAREPFNGQPTYVNKDIRYIGELVLVQSTTSYNHPGVHNILEIIPNEEIMTAPNLFVWFTTVASSTMLNVEVVLWYERIRVAREYKYRRSGLVGV